jgi:hypothetical protein
VERVADGERGEGMAGGGDRWAGRGKERGGRESMTSGSHTLVVGIVWRYGG